MSRTRARLLLIEDDRDLAEGLEDAFGQAGYAVTHAADGPSGLAEATTGLHDLIVLDAMLPSLSGFDLLKELRRRGHQVPVIMLTARGQEVDKVRGLKLGADDYVTKPFGLMELMARIEARLRRPTPVSRPPARLEAKDVTVDFRRREARWRGREIALTGREYEILEALAARRGEAVSRTDLVAHIWGTDDDVEVTTRTVDQHVASLRRKLGDDGQQPHLIETVYGFGYRLVP